MSLESFIEQQIKKAMAEGEFDDLPGKGQPIDLKAYFDTPEHLRMAYSILKNSDFVPEEVQLLKDIEALRAQLDSGRDDAERKRIEKAITEKRLAFNLLMENHRRAK